MQQLNPPLTIIDKESNSIGIRYYTGAEIEECSLHGFKIHIKQTGSRGFRGMLPDQYLYGFASKEEAESALKMITKSMNEKTFVDLSTNIEQSITANNSKRVFIGHGHSLIWRELKDFITEDLKLDYDEFSRISTAGKSTNERLKEMLNEAGIAFIIMTGEDKQPDGTTRSRENVVHEAGLFQGRLGFEKAIILCEEGCHEFSNIAGLQQFRFPKGNIKAIFEDIRKVLKRESILE